MYCSKCGAEIRDGQSFCPSCGTPVLSSDVLQTSNSPFARPNQGTFNATDSSPFAQPIQPVFQKNVGYQSPVYQQPVSQQPIASQNHSAASNHSAPKKKGISIAALVIAIVALFSFASAYINSIIAIVAITFAVIGIVNSDRVRSIVALCIAIPALILGSIINLGKISETSGVTSQSTAINSETSIEVVTVWASAPTSIDEFEYKLNVYDKEVIISSYKGNDEKVWVAYEYVIDGETYKTDLEDRAVFFGNKNVKSVIIEDGIQTVASNCFNSCSNLEYVYIPNTVKRNSGNGIFGYFHGLKELYYGGSNDEFADFSKSVKDDKLNYIPVYVDSILQKDGSGVTKGVLFDKNIVTQEVVYSGDGIWGTSYTPLSDFRYSIIDDEIVLSRYIGEDTEIVLSPYYTIDGVDYPLVSLGDDACFLCETHITSVYIPEGVRYIGDTTFNSCISLQYIYIPSTVENIDSSFFTYLHEYEVSFDATVVMNPERDTNEYILVSDEISDAELLGEDTARAINGISAGMAEEDVAVSIYYAGSEESWYEITED